MHAVDLNCDMGESFGTYRLGDDGELMRHITSANIACGFHAGDPGTMRRTVRLALDCGVAVGAHPGLPDLAGFGRRRMEIEPREAYEMTVYQIGALQALAKAEGGAVTHVKPHGALYNMAANDRRLAEAIAEAVYAVDGGMLLYGLAGSELVRAGERIGLRAIHEAFADRSYEADGTLTPRGMAGAVIGDAEEAAAQVVGMVMKGEVRARQGTILKLRADTICIHGDTPGAAAYAAALRSALAAAGIAVVRAA